MPELLKFYGILFIFKNGLKNRCKEMNFYVNSVRASYAAQITSMTMVIFYNRSASF